MVEGTQHFSMTSTKNSADIAIATNAMADLILKRVSSWCSATTGISFRYMLPSETIRTFH